jgi:hypothetical protein
LNCIEKLTALFWRSNFGLNATKSFPWLLDFQQEESLAIGNKYYISGVEFTLVSSGILLNGFMITVLKIMKIFNVQGINYSPKGYRQGRLARL